MYHRQRRWQRRTIHKSCSIVSIYMTVYNHHILHLSIMYIVNLTRWSRNSPITQLCQHGYNTQLTRLLISISIVRADTQYWINFHCSIMITLFHSSQNFIWPIILGTNQSWWTRIVISNHSNVFKLTEITSLRYLNHNKSLACFSILQVFNQTCMGLMNLCLVKQTWNWTLLLKKLN